MNNTDITNFERKQLAHDFRIMYPQRTEVLIALQNCLDTNEYSSETSGLFIGGFSGVGKTTILESFIEKYPRKYEGVCTQIPILKVSMPARATIKGTVCEILNEIGDPNADRGTLSSLTSRLKRYIKECGVKMIILDEFQHLIDGESKKILINTSNWLKKLMEDAGVPLVLTGIPHAEKIINHDQQLNRRMLWRYYLDPFNYTTEKDVQDFHTLLDLIDSKLPFTKKSELSQPILAERIHMITDGTLGLVMSLIREAACNAIDRNAICLELNDLNTAYKGMEGRQQQSVISNPFTSRKKKAISPIKPIKA